ncbi:MADS-box protein SOC1-like [Prosopis cineraria]|uniref:MADS-box protein SOC1-like n=1 Tax=Prosopis cineraria TaxID=364024 RepID=UPI00240F60D0|nr:MADS-box protein SOC1-like [Prosopis cineraria]
MRKMIERLEASKRKLSGESLNSCSLQELQEIEEQLRKSVKNVQERKNQMFKEKMEKLKEKEKAQTEENARLSVKFAPMTKQARQNLSVNPASTSEINISSLDVETDLFIGLPERRT